MASAAGDGGAASGLCHGTAEWPERSLRMPFPLQNGDIIFKEAHRRRTAKEPSHHEPRRAAGTRAIGTIAREILDLDGAFYVARPTRRGAGSTTMSPGMLRSSLGLLVVAAGANGSGLVRCWN